MDWRQVKESSSRREREAVAALLEEHIDPIHSQWMSWPWLLGRQSGIALVMPTVPFFLDRLDMPLGEFLTEPGHSIGFALSTYWIDPNHRGEGYLRALINVLRRQYTDELSISAHTLDAGRLAQGDVRPPVHGSKALVAGKA